MSFNFFFKKLKLLFLKIMVTIACIHVIKITLNDMLTT